MKLSVTHETHYRFAKAVKHSVQYLRLTPRQDPCQRVLSWTVDTPGNLTPWIDGFGNAVHVSALDAPHDELKVVVEGVVETQDTVGVLPARDGLPPPMFLRETQFTKCTKAIRDLVAPIVAVRDAEGDVPALHALMADIAATVAYEPGVTTVESDATHALEARAGVCQDHAHLFIAGARVLGIPTRYVSGYILAGANNDSHLASHAWAESFVAGLGWVSFDPTNRQSATDQYIRLAIGFDYGSASPVRGRRFGGGVEEMSVRVEVGQTQ